MESTRPIRALMRGLDALTVLNLRNGATVSEVAQEIRLPRTTVYRILETLGNAGFVTRDAADDRYRPTLQVRGLSHGFEDDDWVTQIAKPAIAELGRDLVWPVSLCTLSGTHMTMRETTDHETPLAIERYSAGHCVPLLTTAAGLVHLAFCPVGERDTLIDLLARTARPDLLRLLSEVSAQGYATTTRTRQLVEEVSLGVPVGPNGRLLAVLGIRYVASALPLKAGIERFLPRLRACAAKMAASFSEQQAGAQTNRAPQAAA